MAFTTAGELRQQLASEGIEWTVNPALADSGTLPRYATGADFKGFPMAASLPRIDVAALVAQSPTTNTLLRAHLVERGLVPAGPAELANGSAADLTLQHLTARIGVGPELIKPGSPTAVATSPAARIRAGGGVATAGGAGGTRPASVDWRNRFGWGWITEIRDQDPCEHCWVYASIALIEAQVRIEHCVWCLRSEGDYIEANKVTCGQCGNAPAVLSWMQSNGIVDLDCIPWVDRDPGDRSGTYWNPAPSSCGTGSNVAPPTWTRCSNWSGRNVRLPASTNLGNTDDQKNWLDTVGPLVVGFDVYNDFFGWSGTTPYQKSSTATYDGGHVMLCVGYDDTKNCWIVKNSWGPSWGDGGFGLIGYGQCNIDTYGKIGIQLTNPDPWTKRRCHNGGMVESGDGALHRNFELVAPSSHNTFTHWWRDNSSPSLPWAKAEVLGADVGPWTPTLTGTTYNRNFECVYPTIGGQLRHWWFDQSSQKWNEGETFGSGVAAPVGFVESSYGPGNFEVVYCTASGQLQHYWRDNAFNWHAGPVFASGVRTMGPSLIQSSWGNLELVATLANGEMQHWWRHDNADWSWVASTSFGAGVQSPPVLIQGEYGMPNEYGNGNFELCVAMPDGTVQHWWRDNQDPKLPWYHSATFGSGVQSVVALLEGSFGFNLEVIVIRTDGNLQHYWRSGGSWNAGVVIGQTH
ncbi:MAG TPA: C1 family peptidase [Actinomycetota bacterium]|nr:C1 family peptidase [Actinomycetota bacterium]